MKKLEALENYHHQGFRLSGPRDMHGRHVIRRRYWVFIAISFFSILTGFTSYVGFGLIVSQWDSFAREHKPFGYVIIFLHFIATGAVYWLALWIGRIIAVKLGLLAASEAAELSAANNEIPESWIEDIPCKHPLD